MDIPGRRQPPPGRPGMYVSFWAPKAVLDEIDTLADHWGLCRSAAIKQAITESVTETKDARRKFRNLKRKRP